MKVAIYRDASSTTKANRLNRVALCRDALLPLPLRYPLDTVRDDGNMYRRGLGISVTEAETAAALHAIDEVIVAKAVEFSREWFNGKSLGEEAIRARYKPLVNRVKEEDPYEVLKIKVKCPGAEVATVLHTKLPDGSHSMKKGNIEDLTYGAYVAPIVSASYGLWFMAGGSTFGLSMQAEEMIVVPAPKDGDSLSHFPSSAPLLVEEEVKVPNPPPPSPAQGNVRVELVEREGVDGATTDAP